MSPLLPGLRAGDGTAAWCDCYAIATCHRVGVVSAGMLRSMALPVDSALAARPYGAQSMSAPLREALVVRPGAAFGAAFDDPAHGFLHPVDLDLARREHATFVEVLSSLVPTVPV